MPYTNCFQFLSQKSVPAVQCALADWGWRHPSAIGDHCTTQHLAVGRRLVLSSQLCLVRLLYLPALSSGAQHSFYMDHFKRKRLKLLFSCGCLVVHLSMPGWAGEQTASQAPLTSTQDRHSNCASTLQQIQPELYCLLSAVSPGKVHTALFNKSSSRRGSFR